MDEFYFYFFTISIASYHRVDIDIYSFSNQLQICKDNFRFKWIPLSRTPKAFWFYPFYYQVWVIKFVSSFKKFKALQNIMMKVRHSKNNFGNLALFKKSTWNEAGKYFELMTVQSLHCWLILNRGLGIFCTSCSPSRYALYSSL